MSKMIDGVVMALAALDGMSPEHFHDQKETFRIEYYRRARAAIEAMRNPTEAMVAAGKALGDDYHYDSPAKVWPAMIVALLAEGK